VGNLGFTEILIILLVVLLLFGAKRLPEVGASIGKGIREFKRSLSDTQDAIMGNEDPRTLPPRQPEDPAQEAKPSGEPKRLSQQ
jgi:sec-independent protein translocase protein TatA